MRKIVVIEPASSAFMFLVSPQTYEQQIGERVGVHVIRTKNNLDAPVGLIQQFADTDTVIDNLDIANVISAVEKLDNVCAILAGIEYSVSTALEVAEHFNLPHMPKECLPFVRDKKSFRKKITDAKLSQIAHLSITKTSEINIPSDFPFPAVLKPSDMAGSIKVKKVNNKDEVIALANEIWHSNLTDLSYHSEGELQLEEYIDGKEYSIEGIVYNDSDDVVITSITDKLLGAEPYFVEIGHISNKKFDPAFTQNAHQYTKDIIKAIGLKSSVFHLELRKKANGDIVAIEIAARLAGFHMIELCDIATGVNLAMAIVAHHLNLPYDMTKKRDEVAGIFYIENFEKDIYQGLSGVDLITSDPACLEFHECFKIGDPISKERDFSCLLAYFKMKHPDQDYIDNLIEKIKREVVIN